MCIRDRYHPGWRATIDGQPAEIVRANHVMRGVVVPAGTHTIEFRLAPVSLRNGALVSLAALMLLVTVVVLERYAR
jgi:uncharacterized membrane protein YfhO